MCVASMSAKETAKTIILAQITKADLQKIPPSRQILDSAGVFRFFFSQKKKKKKSSESSTARAFFSPKQ